MQLRTYLAMSCLVILAGCGTKTDMGRVSGVVTLDSQPLAGARVVFQPNDGARGSFGVTDEHGYYELHYTFREKGAKIGRHTVRISTFNEMLVDEASFSMQAGTKELVPKHYNVETALAADVSTGNNVLDWQLNTNGKLSTIRPTLIGAF